MSPVETTAIIIVGGGPVGLSASILLSLRKIPHVLFERHSGTSIHPKACGINQRTTEVFRVMGIEDEVYRQAAPPDIAGRTAWYTGFGDSGKEIASRDAWGGGKYTEEYSAFSASRYCVLPQIRLEPILKRRAVGLNPDGVHYNAEVVSVSNKSDEVLARVYHKERGYTAYRARYALIADGGRMFTDKLGIKWLGEKDIADMVTAHFSSPSLRALHPDPRNFITWFSNPEMGGSTRTGYLYQIGPWLLQDLDHDEWVFVCARIEGDPDRFDEESMTRRLRKTLGFPDLPVKMLSFSHWTVNAIYAETYRTGHIFLVGDSAHKIPPWGALGMNTGIQDVQNLIWKLEFALKDDIRYDRLLDTYQTERLEVGRRVGQTSLRNMRSHSSVMDKALGVSAEQSPEENKSAAAPFFDANDTKHTLKRQAVERAQKVLDSEFKAPGLEIGWYYPSADINNEGGESHGGQRLPDGSLNSEFYFPSTIPGHHLPHCWLERDGERVAIRDLLPLDALALFIEQSLPAELVDGRMRVVYIGVGGYRDTFGDWRQVCGVGKSGGVLVRPDGIVAWRGDLSDFSAQTWVDLVDRVLHCN
ncbi:FAD binding domain-containing protein [Macrophomina phaseolina]|uniref:FAD binding domain-containing protein n=1 Tax=Macrophomina phaseolina TaxID=35725 RepID=A0ABQ8FTM6_9PEZI|nr:FAD binding domain-containing protein [Macrophomina phaseolina]